MTRKIQGILAGLYLGTMGMLVLTACSVDSANSVVRSVNANVAGVYRNSDSNSNNGKLVSANTGSSVTSLDVRQAGDQLEAVDNNGIIFRGTIGDVLDGIASFNLAGRTTAGNKALISGNITIGSGQGTMRGTWIEDSLFGTVFGIANGPSIITNTPPPTTNTNTLVISGSVFDSLMSFSLFVPLTHRVWLTEG